MKNLPEHVKKAFEAALIKSAEGVWRPEPAKLDPYERTKLAFVSSASQSSDPRIQNGVQELSGGTWPQAVPSQPKLPPQMPSKTPAPKAAPNQQTTPPPVPNQTGKTVIAAIIKAADIRLPKLQAKAVEELLLGSRRGAIGLPEHELASSARATGSGLIERLHKAPVLSEAELLDELLKPGHSHRELDVLGELLRRRRK